MVALLHVVNRQRYSLKVPATPTEPPSALWGSNYSWMRWERSTLTGVSLTDRSGVYSSYSICSTSLPSWGGRRGSGRETDIPTPTIQRWPRNGPNPPLYEKPAGVIWQRDPENCWGGVSGGLQAHSQWTPSPASGGVHGRVTCQAQSMTRAGLRDMPVVARSTS